MSGHYCELISSNLLINYISFLITPTETRAKRFPVRDNMTTNESSVGKSLSVPCILYEKEEEAITELSAACLYCWSRARSTFAYSGPQRRKSEEIAAPTQHR